MEDEEKTESKVQAEMQRRHLDLESAVEERVSFSLMKLWVVFSFCSPPKALMVILIL